MAAGLSRWQFLIKGFDKRIVEDTGQYIIKVRCCMIFLQGSHTFTGPKL